MRNRKIVGFLVVVMMMTIGVSVVTEKYNVSASEGESTGDEEFGTHYFDYIKNVTTGLSKIGGDYPKGRAFGTPGEHEAADYLADEMGKIGLYDLGLYEEFPYYEKIEPFKGKKGIITKVPNVDDKLELLAQKIKIKKTGETPEEIDGYISPRWNLTINRLINTWFPRKDIAEYLTNNYSYMNDWLDIKHRPSNDITSALFDMFENQFNGIDGFISYAESEKVVDITNFYKLIHDEFQNYYEFNFNNMDEETIYSLPWFNDSCYNATNEFLFIEEDPSYNPDHWLAQELSSYEKPLSPWLFVIKWSATILPMKFWYIVYPKCQGIMRYDFHEDVYNIQKNSNYPLPVLCINKTKGQNINNNIEDYKIKFYSNQRINQ